MEVLIAIFPLSKGERWAYWALLPLVSVVLPVMLIDATHVISGHRFTTLVPFAAGLIVAITGRGPGMVESRNVTFQITMRMVGKPKLIPTIAAE